MSLLLGPRAALAQGTLLWQQTLNGTANGSDSPRLVAVEQDGNVLDAGVTQNTGTGADFTVAKFAPNGTLLWQQTLNGTANGDDSASSVAVDQDGNVLVAGVTRNTGTGDDFTVVKFAPSGTLLWQQTLNGTANFGDFARSVAVDKDGNVLAAGDIIGRGYFSGFSVVKFAGDGTVLWQRTLHGTIDVVDVARSVAVDKDGNVLAAGRLIGPVFGEFTVVKFAGDGTLLWISGIATPDGAWGALSVAVDTEGNVLAAGDTHNAPHSDFTVAKFAPNGTRLWQQTLNGTANGFDRASSVAVDTAGNVLAAGFTENTVGPYLGISADFTVVKFVPNGTVLWQQTLNGTADYSYDTASSVAVDKDGNVLAAGVTVNTGTGVDFAVAKFDGRDNTPWNFCAPEGGVCAFTGTTEVRYGADGTYVYQTFTDGTACNNAVFGDPIFGTRKSCAIRILPAPTEWTVCAAEGSVCPFSGTREVRYGADGAYVYQTLANGTACTNAVFGDPIYGTVKACAIRIPPAQTEWTVCAAEGGVCAFTGAREVRYGANGVYVYQTLLDGTACINQVFGDPLYGVVKFCSLRTASGSPLTSP